MFYNSMDSNYNMKSLSKVSLIGSRLTMLSNPISIIRDFPDHARPRKECNHWPSQTSLRISSF